MESSGFSVHGQKWMATKVKRKVGRRKKKKMIRLALPAECTNEYCYKCKMLDVLWREEIRSYAYICRLFGADLCRAPSDTMIAERCSNCHMAERYAGGEDIF